MGKNIRYDFLVLGLFAALVIFPLQLQDFSVNAHAASLSSFITINGTKANSSLFETAGIESVSFPISGDVASESYLVNQTIDFELDRSLLEEEFPEDVAGEANFSWDFGDLSKAEGLKNSHAYTKPGSYTMTILATFSQAEKEPQLIESVELNVLPNRGYQLPQAVIKVNGKKIDDPLKETMEIDLNNPITLDASDSIAPSSKIVEYFWDLDDGKTSNTVKTTHRYKLPQYFASPVLYVKDANGFIAYTFVNITNSGKNDPNNPEAEDRRKFLVQAASVTLIPVFIAGGFIVFRKFISKRKG